METTLSCEIKQFQLCTKNHTKPPSILKTFGNISNLAIWLPIMEIYVREQKTTGYSTLHELILVI